MTWLAPVLTLAGTLLGGTLTALVAYFTARATRRHQLEVEDRRFRRDQYIRLRQKRDDLYVRFLQAGKDVEVLLEKYQAALESDKQELVARVEDRVLDFDKLAQEVNLFASTEVSATVDHLTEAWNAWLSAGEDDDRDGVRREARARYRTMFAKMQLEAGPQEIEAALLGEEYGVNTAA
jgi:hypothetical protein